MNQPQGAPRSRSRSGQRRRTGAPRTPVVDIWRTPDNLPALEPIEMPNAVSALVHSLGDPPMNVRGTAGKYFEAVIERSAAAATALAISADLLRREPLD